VSAVPTLMNNKEKSLTMMRGFFNYVEIILKSKINQIYLSVRRMLQCLHR